MLRNILIALAFLILSCCARAEARHRFFDELFDTWPDQHGSPCGTPYTHGLNVEPAYLDRDLLIDYRIGNNIDDEADEQELTFELEWALSKRLGLILELPTISTNPFDGPTETGVGDMAFGTRMLLVNRNRFLLSTIIEVETPTGSAARGLGNGEAAIAPTVAWWLDLGNWLVFQGQFGPEVKLESGETELLYRFAFTKSWEGPVLFHCQSCRSPSHHGRDTHSHDDHGHEAPTHHGPGLFTLYLEPIGTSNLTDSDEGTRFDMTTGISYSLTEKLELRTAVRFPLYRPSSLDSQFLFSVLRHF